MNADKWNTELSFEYLYDCLSKLEGKEEFVDEMNACLMLDKLSNGEHLKNYPIKFSKEGI
jgi:hypothetical protein